MLITSASMGYSNLRSIGMPSTNSRGITSPCGVVAMDGGVPNLGDRSSTFMP